MSLVSAFTVGAKSFRRLPVAKVMRGISRGLFRKADAGIHAEVLKGVSLTCLSYFSILCGMCKGIFLTIKKSKYQYLHSILILIIVRSKQHMLGVSNKTYIFIEVTI